MAIQDNALIVVNRGGTTYKSTWGEVKPTIPQGLSGTITYKVNIPTANFDFRLDAICYQSGSYAVDFGNGRELQYRTVTQTGGLNQVQNTYASAGVYTITIYTSPTLAYAPRMYATNSGKTITDVYFPDPVTCGESFSGCFGFDNLIVSMNIGYNVTSNAQSLANTFLRNQFKYFPLIDTSSVTGSGFNGTWNQCTELEQMPFIDTSNGVSFTSTWSACLSLKEFPALDFSSAQTFQSTWTSNESLTSFPTINVSNATRFDYAWQNCTNLADFPANFFDVTGTLGQFSPQLAFASTFSNCALTAQSVNNILISWDVNGATGLTAGIDGGTNAGLSSLSAAGTTAYNNLIAKGWTITINA